MSAVEQYLALDLSQGGTLSTALTNKLAQEASQSSLNLTAEGERGSIASGLTPGMLEWVTTYVQPVRSAALAELRNDARNVKISNGVDGVFAEVEKDIADQRVAERRYEILSNFNRKNNKLLSDTASVRHEYGELRANLGGHEAKTPPWWLEWGLLLPLIMIPEALLNFESFRRAPIIQSDAMALGATILVGFGIAGAAYMIGLFIKRSNYYREPDNKLKRRAGWPYWAFGVIALIVSLGSVAVARYYYILPQIELAIVTGATPPNMYFSIGSLLFGNLICFLIGAIITFLLNDPNPDYAEKKVEKDRLERRLNKVQRTEVDAPLKAVDERARIDKDAAQRKANLMAGRPGYNEFRMRADKVMAVDAGVRGLLQGYRSALVNEIQARNPRFMFAQEKLDRDRSESIEQITPSQFNVLPLSLSRSVS
jgi:hypothetical protein